MSGGPCLRARIRTAGFRPGNKSIGNIGKLRKSLRICHVRDPAPRATQSRCDSSLHATTAEDVGCWLENRELVASKLRVARRTRRGSKAIDHLSQTLASSCIAMHTVPTLVCGFRDEAANISPSREITLVSWVAKPCLPMQPFSLRASRCSLMQCNQITYIRASLTDAIK